jgi:hypothetical protein
MTNNAKVNALTNGGLKEQLSYNEVRNNNMVTLSNDSGDQTTMSQVENENYTKQVQGHIKDIEIISESQSTKDDSYNTTIKAKVLMNANRKKK